MSTILFLKNNNGNEKVMNTKNITRTNKLKYVHLYICVKTTTNTSTVQCNLWNLCLIEFTWTITRLQFFIAIATTGSKSFDLILSGMSFRILGAKNDNDLVPLYTDFTGLVKMLPYS